MGEDMAKHACIWCFIILSLSDYNWNTELGARHSCHEYGKDQAWIVIIINV